MNKLDLKRKRRYLYKRIIESCWRAYKIDGDPVSLAYNSDTCEMSMMYCFAADHPMISIVNVKVYSPISFCSEKQFKSKISRSIYGYDLF